MHREIDEERQHMGLMGKIDQQAKKRKEEYLACSGLHCPWCKSTDISSDIVEIDLEGGYANCKCNRCEKEWRDIYKLIDMEER